MKGVRTVYAVKEDEKEPTLMPMWIHHVFLLQYIHPRIYAEINQNKQFPIAKGDDGKWEDFLECVHLGDIISGRNCCYTHASNKIVVWKGADLTSSPYSVACRSISNQRVDIVYTNQGKSSIPKNVTHILVRPSVRKICKLSSRPKLVFVKLYNGLTLLGKESFQYCGSLKRITIPSSVKAIGDGAFQWCFRLIEVRLSEGLVKIENGVFSYCRSLQSIEIPSTVTAIGDSIFRGCVRLEKVRLNEGLVEIGKEAFAWCENLQTIKIPSTVTAMGMGVFINCEKLVKIEFCEEIEEFVSMESLQVWWNNGVSPYSLTMYCFFIRHCFPKRLSKLGPIKWHTNIHNMLERIPTVPIRDVNKYLNSLNDKLAMYETARDAASLLELAIWKSKLAEQCVPIDDNLISIKSQLRMKCGACVVIPKVLSFLMGVDSTSCESGM